MIEAPVATITSIILYLIMSEYIFIQPAAEVEPAKVKKIVQFLSDNISLNIFDAGVLNFVLPARMIPNGRMTSKKLTSFSLYGPTCDSADFMKGPFILPNNIKEGDYIEIGQLGAYALTFRTKFNGFYSNKIFEVQDTPIMSMYEKDSLSRYLVA